MDKEKLLNDFFLMLLDTLKAAKDFSMEQLPLVCKEYITYNFYQTIFGGICGFVLFAAGVICFVKAYRLEKDIDYRGDGYVALYGFGFVLVLGGAVDFAVNVSELIQIHFAPRVYLLDYVSHLIRR